MPKPRSSNDNLLSPLFDQQKINANTTLGREHLFAKTQFIGPATRTLAIPLESTLSRAEWPIGGYGFITTDGNALQEIASVAGVTLNGTDNELITLPAVGNILLILMREAPNQWLLSGSIPGGGGRSLISEQFVGTQSSALFENIPGSFTKLELEIAASITTLTTQSPVFLRVGIAGVIQSGNSYRGGGFAFNFSSGTASLQTQTSFIQEATIPQVLAPNNNPQEGYSIITLPNYASGDDFLAIQARIANIPPTLLAMFEGQYSWYFQNLNNDVIDTLQLTLPSPETFGAFSVIRLYGS